MKKILITSALIATMAVTPFCFVGCKKDKEPASANSLSATEFYAMGLTTGVNYLDSVSGTSQLASSLTTETKADLETYVNMFSGFMDTGIHPTKADTTAEDGVYDSTYAKKLTITIGSDKYTMYYNEEIVNVEHEPNEVEVEKYLEGVAVKGGSQYYVVGSENVDTENENGTTEVETDLKIYLSDNAITVTNKNIKTAQFASGAKYIKIEEEREADEIEYKYINSENPQNPIKIDWENEDGREELELRFGTTKYIITLDSQNKYKVIEIKGDVKTTFYMTKNNNAYTYTNSAGQAI